MRAAQNLLAGPEDAQPYDGLPFFWSDQYEHFVQMVGWPAAADEIEIVHEDGPAFLALFREGDTFGGALAVDQRRILTRLRRQLMLGATYDEARAFALEQLAAS